MQQRLAALRDLGRSGADVAAAVRSAAAGAAGGGTPARPYQLRGGLAVIPVVGALVKYDDPINPYLGLVSAASVGVALRQADADEAVSSIALYIDCPGGQAAGTFALADAIAAVNARRPVHAVVSDLAASGGYLLASQCRTITANESAFVGSVGVVTVLVDDTKFRADLGVGFSVVSTGPYKGQGMDGAVTDAFKADVARENDGLFQLFKGKVAVGRGLSMANVGKFADGRCWIAADAVRYGLIDAVAPVESALAAVADPSYSPTPPTADPAGNAQPDPADPAVQGRRAATAAIERARGKRFAATSPAAGYEPADPEPRSYRPDVDVSGRAFAGGGYAGRNPTLAPDAQTDEQVKANGQAAGKAAVARATAAMDRLDARHRRRSGR